MSEELIDVPQDDIGYSELFTVDDYLAEAQAEYPSLHISSCLILYWNLLKRECTVNTYSTIRPQDSWSLGVYRGNGIAEDEYFNFIQHEKSYQ